MKKSTGADAMSGNGAVTPTDSQSEYVNLGWVRTLMLERGIRIEDAEALRNVLSGLTPEQRRELKAKGRSLARGEDERGIAWLVALATCARKGTAESFEKIGVAGREARPAVLFEYFTTEPDAGEMTARAGRGDEQEVRKVRAALERISAKMPEDRGTDEGQRAEHMSDDGTSSVEPHGQGAGQDAAEDQADRKDRLAGKDGVQGERTKRKHHVYGQKGALLFELDTVRSAAPSWRNNTLRIEGAKATAPSVYAWDNKVIFQLTLRELHQFAGVCLGLVKAVKFEGHGEGNDKRLEAEVQEGRLFAKVTHGRTTVAVPIGIEDLYDVAVLAQRALKKNDPDFTLSELMATVRAVHVMSNGSGK